MRIRHVFSLLGVLFLTPVLLVPVLSPLVPFTAFAQATNSAQSSETSENIPKKTFLQLRNTHNALQSDVVSLETEIRNLDTAIYWLEQKEFLNAKLTALEKDVKVPEKDKDKERESLRDKIKQTQENSNTPLALKDASAKLQQKQVELGKSKKEKDKIEIEISDRLNVEKPKQEFRGWVSLGGAFLVFLVIIGFFIIAIKDETVRRQIFSAETGIQFITLFSLVIAIILFGVSDILEGKELSALLGGLSGYILGRTSGPRSTASAQSTVSSPKITEVSPKIATLGAGPTTVPLQITGTDLQLASSVKIAQGTKEILVSNITSNNLAISCTLTLDPNLPKGNYNLTVTNSDGGVAKLSNGFTIQ